MATVPSVNALNALALVASALPNVNPPTPIYAIVASDTFIPLTIPSSWGEFSPKYETQLSDYPQEQGAFQPYNKVKRPQTINVTMIKTGSDVARFAWFTAIRQQEALNPTQLYTLISPVGVFVDFTIASMSIDVRPDRGSNLTYLNILFTEVPQITSSDGSYQNTLSAKSNPVAQIGQVFTTAVTAAQQALVNAAAFITS
jgi:hypothetical protein